MDPLMLPLMMYGSYSMHTNQINSEGKKEKIKRVYTHVEGIDKGFFPSVNHIYVNTKYGGKKLKPAAEALFSKWQWLAKEWAMKNNWSFEKTEKIVLEMTLYYPDHVKRDSHNVIKLLLDALQGILYDNDYYALPRIQNFHVLKEKNESRIEIVPKKGVGNNGSN